MKTGAWLVAMSAVLMSGCATVLPPDALKDVPKASDHPDDDYVVLLDETLVDYEPGPGDGPPQRVERWRRRIKLLKPTTLSPLTVGYSRTFTRVESIRMWKFDPSGRGEELSTEERADLPSFSGSVLFTDSRAVRVPIKPLPVGAIFEQEIVTRDLDVRPFVTSETFGDTHPTMKERLVVTAPADWELRWLTEGDAPEPQVSRRDGRQVLTFEMSNLESTERADHGPPLWMLLPRASVRLEKWFEGKAEHTAWKTPERLSNYLSTEYAKQAAITPGLEQQVREVLAGVPDEPEAKARALYEFACRSIQYCAVEVGYGGWIPHSAEDVRKGRYGDCKDKATYLHALLKVANISSAPTLIYAHDGTPRPFGLPSLGSNFNHAILAVDLPGRTVYADPTHRTVPFGQLPPSDQEATVLEVREGGVELKTTAASQPGDNVEHQQVRLTMDAAGDATGSITVATRGARALPMKNQLMLGTGRLAQWLDGQVWTRNTHVSDAKATRTGDFADDIELEGQLLVRHAVLRGASGDALLRVSDVLDPVLRPIPEDRKQARVWRFPETLRTTVSIALPAGGAVGTLPQPVELDSPIGRYSLSWRAIDGGLEISRELVRKQRTLGQRDFEEANRFERAIATAEHRAATLRLPSGGAR